MGADREVGEKGVLFELTAVIRRLDRRIHDDDHHGFAGQAGE
jgi:hypothetical protein